jgi:signal transduction histidine kinase
MMGRWGAMWAEQPALAGREPHLRTAVRVLGLVGLVYALATATHPGAGGVHLAALVLIAGTALAWVGWLVAQQVGSLPGSVASLCALAACGATLVVLSPLGIAVVGVACVAAATILDPAPVLGLAAGCVAVSGVAVAVSGHGAGILGGVASGALGGVAVGVIRRQQQARAEQAVQLAVARQRGELEHQRAEVLAERNHIAREVHDVLAHTLGALSVQMEALDSLLGDGADAAVLRAAVRRSRRLVVEGLEETRRAVRVLREEPVAVAEQLTALAHDDGATCRVRGTPRPLPPAAGLALLRVAQEALTNARKHAPGAPVSITLTFAEHATRLRVDNPLPPADQPGAESRAGTDGAGTGDADRPRVGATGGYGLRGMRERIELLGGALSVGPSAGGWQVYAEIPA